MRATTSLEENRYLFYSLFMTNFLSDSFYWVIFLVLIVNMSQRKIENSDRKRQATIILAVLFLVFYTFAVLVNNYAWPSWTLIAVGLLLLVLAIVFRARVWPFRLHCKGCGKRMDYNHIIGHDDNLCQDCYDLAHPEEAEARRLAEEEKQKAAHPLVVEQESFNDAQKVDEVNWDLWEPTDRCVITYVEKDDELLFIEKKIGLGAGYYNAPGGHIEEDETSFEAAARETKEETGLEIVDLEYRGRLYFQFKEGIRELGYVFFAKTEGGELKESEETRPFWVNKSEIPFENMWEDDRLWLPGALEGKKFEAYFIFDGKTMLDAKIEWESE